MKSTSDEQRDDIRNFLIGRGLAFKPLLDEMSDHIACDLESRMNQGLSYEEAWKQTINELPEDHFKKIQTETMETINQRFNVSRVFTWAALGALFLTAIFKISHLQGTSELTLLAFVALAAALVAGSVSGTYVHRDKKGAVRLFSIVAGILIMMVGYAFKIEHLPGADQLILSSFVILMLSMLINSFYAYNKNNDQSLFTFLHEKYTPGIERFLLLLIIPILVSKMILIILVFAAGIQLIALSWRYMEQSESNRTLLILVALVFAICCLLLPMLGEIVPLQGRLAAIVLFSVAGVILSLKFDGFQKGSGFVFVAPIMFGLTSAAKLGLAVPYLTQLSFNVSICAAIAVGIFLTPKYSVSRTFLIMSLGYLLEL